MCEVFESLESSRKGSTPQCVGMHFFCFTKAKDPKHSWSFLPSRLRRSLSDFEISRFLNFFSLGGLGLTVYKFDQCFASVWNISHSTSPCFIVGTVRQSRDKHYHQYVLCLLHRCLASRTIEIQIAMLHLNTLAPRLIWQHSLDALCQHWMHVSTPLAPRDCISKFANCRLMHLHFADSDYLHCLRIANTEHMHGHFAKKMALAYTFTDALHT